MALKDVHGRIIKKLRISLTDSCNFRCFYCMPSNPQFMHQSKLLSPQEFANICSLLVDQGINQIRITGGEPTLRRNFKEIVTKISQLPITKLGITSNGFLLGKYLDFLKSHHCHHINISLDSLRENRFNKITGTNSFRTVLNTILQTKKMGFNLKINTVLMKGYNDDEILDFVDFSATHDIEVRFLEAMKIGQILSQQNSLFVSAQTAIEEIKKKYELTPMVKMEPDSTSFNFLTKEGANIGFIASESRPFCNSCSRWRLSADGILRACLMSGKGINLRSLNKSELALKLAELLKMKPRSRIKEIHQDMHAIGG